MLAGIDDEIMTNSGLQDSFYQVILQSLPECQASHFDKPHFLECIDNYNFISFEIRIVVHGDLVMHQ